MNKNNSSTKLENLIYKQAAEEIAAGKFSPGPWAKAYEKAQGNNKLAESLYIKFRTEEISLERGIEAPVSMSKREKWRKELSDFLALPSPQLISLLIVLALVILIGSCMGLFR